MYQLWCLSPKTAETSEFKASPHPFQLFFFLQMGERYGFSHRNIPTFEQVVAPALENLQPLRKGRDITSLEQLAREAGGEREARISREKGGWKARLQQLREDSGALFGATCEYLEWTDKNYPNVPARSRAGLVE